MPRSPSPTDTDYDDEHPFDTFQQDFDLVVHTAIRLNYMRVVDHKDRLVHPETPPLVALLRFFPSLQEPVARSFIRMPVPSHLREKLLDLVTVSYTDLEQYILGKYEIPATVFKHALLFSLKNDPSGNGAPEKVNQVRNLIDMAIDAIGVSNEKRVVERSER